MAEMADRCRAVRLFLSDVDGVLTDSGMYYGERGDELKRFSTLDGGGFYLLRMVGIECGLLTTEDTALLERRAKKLGIPHVVQNARNKGAALDDLLSTLGMSDEEVAYIGDDINDIVVIERVGVSATVPNHCLPDSVTTDYVTSRPGGSGAVRDFAEWLLRQRGEYDRALALYLKRIRGL
jgi:3-deoxy-D-manno-octulosonate 8-phosphate phosphatase (KDO 8-P phosphatase)